MKNIVIGHNGLKASQIALGCMRLIGLETPKAARSLIDTAMANGINFFDHADIYGGGACEELFGEAITPELREKMVIQTKCAIRPGICYDFSKEHILESVDKSLKRLKTDYIDILLLHRPDALMEPEEVAEAFYTLKKSGKVRNFGVSNHSVMQIELLNKYCAGEVTVNQLQYSIAHCPSIDAGMNVNIDNSYGCNRDGGMLDYARLHDITIQAWSPFQYGMFKGVFIGNELYKELNAVMERLAEKYGVSVNAIAVAWILRHPAGIQCIVGSMNEERLKGICEAANIELTREEWYELYLAAGKDLP